MQCKDPYDRILVKNIEIASGPSFPGPDATYYSCIITGQKYNYVKYNCIWYRLNYTNLRVFINQLLECDEQWQVNLVMNENIRFKKLIDIDLDDI